MMKNQLVEIVKMSTSVVSKQSCLHLIAGLEPYHGFITTIVQLYSSLPIYLQSVRINRDQNRISPLFLISSTILFTIPSISSSEAIDETLSSLMNHVFKLYLIIQKSANQFLKKKKKKFSGLEINYETTLSNAHTKKVNKKS